MSASSEAIQAEIENLLDLAVESLSPDELDTLLESVEEKLSYIENLSPLYPSERAA